MNVTRTHETHTSRPARMTQRTCVRVCARVHQGRSLCSAQSNRWAKPDGDLWAAVPLCSKEQHKEMDRKLGVGARWWRRRRHGTGDCLWSATWNFCRLSKRGAQILSRGHAEPPSLNPRKWESNWPIACVCAHEARRTCSTKMCTIFVLRVACVMQ